MPLDPRLRLLLAATTGPVSIDALASTNLWRPSTLLAAIEDARLAGQVEVDANREHLVWKGSREDVLSQGAKEDLAALLTAPACVEWLLQGARAAVRGRHFPAAEALYRALVHVVPAQRAAFPGGEATWVATVLEATRLFRSAWLIDPAVLDAAIAFAEEHGDLATQAVLLSARGVRTLSEDLERAHRFFDWATEAAEALADPRIRAEVRTYIAVSLILSGRPGAGIAAFEALVGAVQGDLLDPHSGILLDLEGAVPASALSLLAHAYATLGDHPRAVDLMERALARGVELENRALEAQGHVMLGVAFMLAGDRTAAAAHAEAAAPWFSGLASPYAWACALTLAWSRLEKEPKVAHQILSAALPGYLKTGRYWIGGSRALELLQGLEQAGLPPLPGLSLTEEIARHLDAPQPLFAGIAHRWAALLAPQSPEVRAHLARATKLLREAGGGPELWQALADEAAAAEQDDDRATAERLRAELPRQAPRHGQSDPLRLANAVLDLGRLTALPTSPEGPWGEIAARLCHELGAERCAVVLLEETGPKTLAARGAPGWSDLALRRVTQQPPHTPVFEPALGGTRGQAVLVPFDDGAARRGVLVLENRDTTAKVTPADTGLVAALGRQLGILLGNLGLWRELQSLRQRLEQENRYYRESTGAAPLGGGRIVGGGAAMREVLALVQRVAPSTTPVLVTGETGVGKELIAREVHLASRRQAGPFITVHVAALPSGLVASALFGHERGAFTGATTQARGRFELAHGGTLFLDEVGELSLDDQVRLLRVLQDGTFERVGGSRPLRSDFRLVAATNRDLSAEVRAGQFREDLYFRLAAFPIRVPPLRERRDEVPTLALFFLERVSRKLGLRFDGLLEEDLERLVRYPWPGNVRELEHVIERAALLSDPPRLRLPVLEDPGLRGEAPAGKPLAEEWVTLAEVERRYVRRVLYHVHGRVSGPGGAAELLGLKPSTLQFWIDQLGLRDELALARRGRPRRGKKTAG